MNSEEYISNEECVEFNIHLTSCDNDGYCNHCGEQEPIPEELQEDEEDEEFNRIADKDTAKFEPR